MSSLFAQHAISDFFAVKSEMNCVLLRRRRRFQNNAPPSKVLDVFPQFFGNFFPQFFVFFLRNFLWSRMGFVVSRWKKSGFRVSCVTLGIFLAQQS